MLRTQPGIHSVKVALLAERGTVEYDSKVWNPEKLISVRYTRNENCLVAHSLCRKSLTLGSMPH